MNTWLNKATSLLTGFVMAFLMTADGSATAEANTSISTTYKKYNFDTNKCSYYTLTIDNNSSAQSRVLLPPDERVRDGHDGIVRLSIGGTGFIIGDHTIATAAHCINVQRSDDAALKAQFRNVGYFYTDLEIYTYTNSGVPETAVSLTPVELHVPYEYLISDSFGSDYALITVEEDLSEYTHFNLGIPYNPNSTAFGNLDLFVTGIPGTAPGDTSNDVNLLVYTGKGKESPHLTSDEEALFFTCDSSGGDSGGPVYLAYQYTTGSTTSTVYTAIAIHNGDASDGINSAYFGSAMTPYKLQFFKNNSEILY